MTASPSANETALEMARQTAASSPHGPAVLHLAIVPDGIEAWACWPGQNRHLRSQPCPTAEQALSELAGFLRQGLPRRDRVAGDTQTIENADGTRWLRSGPDLWLQARRSNDGVWVPISGWRFATAELARAALKVWTELTHDGAGVADGQRPGRDAGPVERPAVAGQRPTSRLPVLV